MNRVISTLHFTNDLLEWYDRNQRQLFWRDKKTFQIDAYVTWVCEVMSQQTSLSVVVPRLQNFLKSLPNLKSLAECSESQLRQLWAGLGYYSRAQNLQKTANIVLKNNAGIIPLEYNELLKLPGIGPYTAAVIASVCGNQAVACVDGNVIRVVSRLLDLREETWKSSGQKKITSFAQHTIDPKRPGDFNQATMDLGSTVCTKGKPGCSFCPVSVFCSAYKNGSVVLSPPKKPRKDSVNLESQMFFLTKIQKDKISDQNFYKNEISVALFRRKKGLLKNTLGLPLVLEPSEKLVDLRGYENFGSVSHSITHHRMKVFLFAKEFSSNRDEEFVSPLGKGYLFEWVPLERAAEYFTSSLDKKCLEKYLKTLFRASASDSLFN